MVKAAYTYFIIFVTVMLSICLLAGVQQSQTGFFTVNDTPTSGNDDGGYNLQPVPGSNQSEKEFEIACGGIPPVVHWVNATPNPAVVGQTINFTAKVTDNYEVRAVFVEINGTNHTMKKCTAGCTHYYFGISDFDINCYYDDHDGCWVKRDLWCYSWNATTAGNYTYTVCARDWMGNWACKSGNLVVLPQALAIALSTTLVSGVEWNVTTLPVYNYSAIGNNASGVTQYYVIIDAVGMNADLYVKASGNLLSGNSSIPLANEKLSFNITNSTVPSSAKKSLTTNYTNNQIGYNLTNNTRSWLKFFLDVPSGQPAGAYNNTLMFKVVQTGTAP